MRRLRTTLVAGVDEAGRGPLAGPVVVAAVILAPGADLPGLDDSKRVAPGLRDRLYASICESAVSWSVIEVAPADIDRMNILAATLWGMQQAVARLDPRPDLALVDGNRVPELSCETRAIVQGDRLEAAISAASILAKVSRDRLMEAWHQRYPHYGFDRHKGYPTAEHLEMLHRYGPCAIHRRSFAPVRLLLQPELL